MKVCPVRSEKQLTPIRKAQDLTKSRVDTLSAKCLAKTPLLGRFLFLPTFKPANGIVSDVAKGLGVAYLQIRAR